MADQHPTRSDVVVRLPLTEDEDRWLTMLAKFEGVSKGELLTRAWDQWKARHGH
jgi:hypothetical protein